VDDGPKVEIKLRFQISPLNCRRGHRDTDVSVRATIKLKTKAL